MFNQNLKTAKLPTKVIKKKRVLTRLEDGRMVFADYKNQYKDIPASSYSLRSQLENGVHLVDCGISQLEGVYGSDKLRFEVAQAQYNFKKSE